MDISYKFSSLAKESFVKFLKLAEEQKQTNLFCDHAENNHKQLFPLDENTKIELEEYIKNCDCIYIKEDDNEDVLDKPNSSNIKINQNELHFDLSKTTSTSFISDLSNAIKENLELDKSLPETLLNDLFQNTDEQLQQIFQSLGKELQTEDVVVFGEILLKSPTNTDTFNQNYIKHLLLLKCSIEYTDNLQNLFNEFTIKFPPQLIQMLSEHLSTFEDTNVICLYINKTSNDFKASLFNTLVYNCAKLNKNYISQIDILLNTNADLDSLNKLVQIMSNQVTEFSTDKSYGKVLFNVIKLLDKHVIHLERPLNHIIGSHSSIWKPKIMKLFNSHMENSLLFTQSFRYN